MRISAALLCAALGGCVSSNVARDVSDVRSRLPALGDGIALREESRDTELDGQIATLLREPLDAERAVRIALLSNRDLQADLRALGVARGMLLQASLLPNLEFDASARIAPGGSVRWEFGAGFDLTRAMLTGLARSAGEANVEAARARAASDALSLVTRVRQAFYAYLALVQRKELAETAMQAFAASYDATRVLHEAGNVTDLDLVNDQAAYEGARLEVAEVEIATLDAREALNVLLGVSGEHAAWRTDARLSAPSELPPLESLEQQAISASLRLAEGRGRIESLARSRGLARAEGLLPHIEIGVTAEEHEDSSWVVGPAISASVPLFDRQQGRVLALASELDAARDRYVADAIAVRAATRKARNRVLSAEARVAHLHGTILPVRQRVLAESLLQYNAMQIGVFQLLQAKRDQLDAARTYIATLEEYWQARAVLDGVLQGLFVERDVAPRSSGANVSRQVSGGGH